MNKNTFIKNTEAIPAVTYINIVTNKYKIIEDNKRKSGIYRWTFIKSGKTYIGSSKTLNERLNDYFSLTFLKRQLSKGSSVIYSALLKHGYNNFSLDILEYCSSDKLLIREQYYLDLLKPEYNICKTAGSTLGFKHSEVTKAKLSVYNKGINNPNYGKKHTYETRLKISINNKGTNHPLYGKEHKDETKKKIGESLKSRNLSRSIKIFDELNNLIKEFPNITSTAKYFNKSIWTIYKHLNKNTRYKGFIIESD